MNSCAVLNKFESPISTSTIKTTVVLTDEKIRQIIILVTEWHWSVKKVSSNYSVTPARIYQLVSSYRKTGMYPVIHKRGRKTTPIPERTRNLIISVKREFNLSSAATAKYLLVKYRIHIGSMKVHKVLLEEGLTHKDSRKSFRRKEWIRYEREHSLSAVHMDWYACSDGKTNVCVVLDDASRMILSGGEFSEQTSANSIAMLKEAYDKYEYISPIREVITDHGTQFYAVNRDEDGNADHAFEDFCAEYGIYHILARVKHPQTNGKMERWFQTYQKNRERFTSFQQFADWYNKRRPHMSLDWDNMETPEMAFYRKAVDHIRSNAIAMFAREMEET